MVQFSRLFLWHKYKKQQMDSMWINDVQQNPLYVPHRINVCTCHTVMSCYQRCRFVVIILLKLSTPEERHFLAHVEKSTHLYIQLLLRLLFKSNWTREKTEEYLLAYQFDSIRNFDPNFCSSYEFDFQMSQKCFLFDLLWWKALESARSRGIVCKKHRIVVNVFKWYAKDMIKNRSDDHNDTTAFHVITFKWAKSGEKSSRRAKAMFSTQ